MAIVHPTAPEKGMKILTDSLSSLFLDKQVVQHFLKDTNLKDLHVTEPHQVYTVELEEIINKRLLSAAQPAAWRYLLIDNSKKTAVLEADLVENDDGEIQFNGLYQSPFSYSTVKALESAENLTAVRNNDFEIRFLKVPAVYFAALWLHNDSQNIIIPLKESREKRSQTDFSESEIIEALHSKAIQMKK